MKKYLVLVSSGFLVLSVAVNSFAKMCNMRTAQAKEEKKVTEAEEVGNKICPVSGEKIDENTKATYEYEGKIYNFCCAMCIEEFKKDPEKYIKKLEEMEKEKHQGHHQSHQGHTH